jgi:hypothetical protein
MFRREAVSSRVYETPIAKLSESFRRRKNLEKDPTTRFR